MTAPDGLHHLHHARGLHNRNGDARHWSRIFHTVRGGGASDAFPEAFEPVHVCGGSDVGEEFGVSDEERHSMPGWFRIGSAKESR